MKQVPSVVPEQVLKEVRALCPATDPDERDLFVGFFVGCVEYVLDAAKVDKAKADSHRAKELPGEMKKQVTDLSKELRRARAALNSIGPLTLTKLDFAAETEYRPPALADGGDWSSTSDLLLARPTRSACSQTYKHLALLINACDKLLSDIGDARQLRLRDAVFYAEEQLAVEYVHLGGDIPKSSSSNFAKLCYRLRECSGSDSSIDLAKEIESIRNEIGLAAGDKPKTS